jgi:hypothetical protein
MMVRNRKQIAPIEQTNCWQKQTLMRLADFDGLHNLTRLIWYE